MVVKMGWYVEMVLALVFVAILVLQLGSSAPLEPKIVGLYGVEDNVTILTGLNFNKTVFNSQYIWMVEFYASWCGHCQEFAPTFKAFAKDIAEWDQVFRLAVINCPDDHNHPVCISMDIDGFPTMKVFAPFSTEKETGMPINERTVENLRNASVTFIDRYLGEIKWDLPGTLKPSFNFITYEEILDFLMASGTPHYLPIVIETMSSEMGKQIILDMSSCKNITVRRFNSAAPEIKKLVEYTGMNFQELPTVVLFQKGGKAIEIEVKLRRRSFYSYKLHQLPGVGDPKPLPKQIIDSDFDIVITYIDWTKVDRSKVYVVDIESGLRYALMVEIGSSRILSGASLEAVKDFVGTLALLSGDLPLRKPTKSFLIRLTGWLAGKTEIDYKTWEKRMESVEPGSYLPKLDQRWVGCAPSKPGLRGYPCSLWTLFHALTVAAYNKNEQDFQAVPRAMESYITNFFSCMECRRNFIREISNNQYEDTKSTKDVILWLWELHNNVNKRLHGAVSEDPSIPKVQFPSTEFCSDCRSKDGSWDKDNVLNYLVDRYSTDQISKEFINKGDTPKGAKAQDDEDSRDELENMHLDGDLGDVDYKNDFEIHAKFEDEDFDAGVKNYGNPQDVPAGHIDPPSLVKELLKDRRKGHSIHIMKHTADKELARRIDRLERDWHKPNVQPTLSSFDMSMCVVLWGTSFIVVTFLYLYMRRRNALQNCRL